MPARRTSRPSCRRSVRASITAATRPSPCGSNAQPAETAGSAAASTRPHVIIAAANSPRRRAVVVTGRMTLFCVQTQLRYAGDDRQRNSLSEIGLMTKGETMEVNGIAHIFLTASNFERSREFYRKLLPFLGLKPVIDTETSYYC